MGKLLKYDLKKMTRILIYFYICSIGLACVTRIFDIWNDIYILFIFKQVFAGITYSAIASVLINTFVHILNTFITGFYKDESYLTHTLPVTKSKLLLSKYLAGLIVIVMSVFVSFLSLFIMFYTPQLMATIGDFLSINFVGLSIPVWVIVMLLVFIILFHYY